MKIFIGSDHAGFELKRELVAFLSEVGNEVIDCGPEKYNHEDDYPDYCSIVAENIYRDQDAHSTGSGQAKGIVIGWSGQGEAMITNRYPKVRCAVFYGGPKHVLTLSREHNDANILSLGAHFLTSREARHAVELWLGTEFSGDERHIRRIEKIEEITT